MAPHSSERIWRNSDSRNDHPQHDFSLTDVGVKTQWNAELRLTESIFSCPHATIYSSDILFRRIFNMILLALNH